MAKNVDDAPEVRTSTSEENKLTSEEEKLTSCSVIYGANTDKLMPKRSEGLQSEVEVGTIPPVASKEVDGPPCDKYCTNGHPCIAKRGEDCPPCQVKVLLVSNNCGHRMVFPCFIGVQEKYKKNCFKMSRSPWICKCGATIHLPCFLGGKRLTWDEAMMFCPKCGEDKDMATVIAYSSKYGK